MDAGLTAAAEALRAGDPLGALPRVARRRDGPALALRGIAMAQLGDLRRARALLRDAARALGPDAPLARARCLVAQAEVALAARELARWPEEAVAAAARALARSGDRANALLARLLVARRLLLAGRVAEAERTVATLDLSRGTAAHRTVAALLAFEVALRRGRSAAARHAVGRARRAAAQAAIPALRAEVDRAGAALELPAARLAGPGPERPLTLAETERILASGELVVDARRRTITAPGRALDLSRRPVLFALARHLAEAWPGEAPRAALVQRAFGLSRASASLRGRLRVDVGRLRRALAGLAGVGATPGGFALVPAGGAGVAVLAPPEEGEDGALLALLADGEPWSTSALALAAGASARTVQRALARLAERGRARAAGRGRGRRWLLPVPEGITLSLPLPPPGPGAHGRVRARRTAGRGVGTGGGRARPAAVLAVWGPFKGGRVHGVTWDGARVWFATARALRALDPATGAVVRSLDVACEGGTAFDGRHLFQLAGGRILEIDPSTGELVSTLPAPDGAGCSGLTWAEGSLWIGRYGERLVQELDPRTGAVLRTLPSNRFVTGVTWVDGELWHGTWEGDESELRRLDPEDGRVLARLALPRGVVVTGLESDGDGRFFCGGGDSGTVRVVRRPGRRRRGSGRARG